MLVLSRKTGERIHIGDDVTITVTKVAGNRVAIGIEAPREAGIRRGELEGRRPFALTTPEQPSR